MTQCVSADVNKEQGREGVREGREIQNAVTGESEKERDSHREIERQGVRHGGELQNTGTVRK